MAPPAVIGAHLNKYSWVRHWFIIWFSPPPKDEVADPMDQGGHAHSFKGSKENDDHQKK